MQSKCLFRMFLIASGVLISLSIQAQYQEKVSPWEIGAGASAFVYMGDLTTHRLGSVETIRPGGLAFVNYNITSRWAIQSGFAIGSLKGDDAEYANPAFRRERNFAFTSSVRELSLKGQYNLFNSYKVETTTLSPYISTGIAVDFINVKTYYSGLTTKLINEEPEIAAGLQRDIINGTPGTIFTIPITIGVRKVWSEQWDVFTEANFRYNSSDYLDGFSESANSKTTDKFYSINVGLIYKFRRSSGLGCPRF